MGAVSTFWYLSPCALCPWRSTFETAPPNTDNSSPQCYQRPYQCMQLAPGCNKIGFKAVFFSYPSVHACISHEGWENQSPHSVSSSLTHLAAGPMVPLPVLEVGGRKMRGAVVLPGEVSCSVSQAHLAWGCAHQGLQDFWPYPHLFPKPLAMSLHVWVP